MGIRLILTPIADMILINNRAIFRLSPEQHEHYIKIFNIIKQIPSFSDTMRKFRRHPERLDVLAKVVSDIFNRIYALSCRLQHTDAKSHALRKI
jgi:hypothetical protein